jgi:hypothetical protein
MIKFEHNMLVLNNAFSNDDVLEINAFADYVRLQERERIIALIEAEAETWSSDCDAPLEPEHCQSCWLFCNLIELIKAGNQ